jgi:hypothetical protein
VFSVSYELRRKKQLMSGHRNNIVQPEGSTPIDEAESLNKETAFGAAREYYCSPSYAVHVAQLI